MKHDQAGRRIAAGALLLLVLALGAAGCGGNSDKQSNEDYANSVCTDISAWADEIKTIATTFTGVPSQATLEAKLTEAETATSTLVGQIKDTPAPDTSEGQAAKQQLDQLAADANTTIDAAKTAVSGLGTDASPTQIGSALLALAPQVQGLASSAKATISSLKDAGGDLASAFEDSKACQDLG